MELTSLDMHYAVKELRGFIGGKVQKVMQSDENKRDILLSLYHPELNKPYLRFNLPGMFALYDEKPEVYPKNPPQFAMFLRKYIKNAWIKDVRQRGFDRILEMELDSKHGVMVLVFEMLQPGNCILVIDGKIKNLLEPQNFKDRTLRGGAEYAAPPRAFDPREAGEDEIALKIKESTRDRIVVSLAITIGLGGEYAEEACKLAGIDKNASNLTQDEMKRISLAVKQLLEKDIEPHASDERVYPFKMESRATSPIGHKRFIRALSSGFEEKEAVVSVPKREKKLETMRSAQEKQIEKFEKDAVESQRKGELIYEHYQEIADVIHTAQKNRRDALEALKEMPIVVAYDSSTAIAEVELDE